MISMKSGRMARAGLVAAALAISSLPFNSAAAAEKWDLYVYNAVSTVSAVKGMNTVIEQIEKEEKEAQETNAREAAKSKR